MMSNKSDVEVLTQDWVRKFHFENKVDLNLQLPAENESTKIEVGEIPIDLIPKLEFTKSNNNNNDSYLQSILSSPSAAPKTSSTTCTGSETCVCYKCQRQRRRTGINRNTPINSQPVNSPPPVNSQPNTPNRVATEPPISSTCSNNSPTMVSPQSKSIKRSSTLRKTPTLRSYERHMPKPTYAQKDSIYRIEVEESKEDKKTKANNTQSLQKDSYTMAWKEDETGDDLLSSLVTFQTIFEEKGNGNEGLSDLLEQRTKELKYQKLREQQDSLRSKSTEPNLPPRQPDCLTLSYRNGPRHNPLTLYHTMKMHGEQERMCAYNTAFQHCIKSNSGLRSWVKKARVAPTRESSKLMQTIRRPTIKRSLLHPLSSRKNKVAGDDLLLWSTSSESLSVNSTGKKSIDMISSPIPLVQPSPTGLQNNHQLTDVLSAAQALLPNQNLANEQQILHQKGNKVPYEHIDTPSRPRHTQPISQSPVDCKDNSSVSSSESASGAPVKIKKSRPGRLFSSLGRKTSMRSYGSNKEPSIRSLEKIDSGNESQSHEKVLDDLCHILPHINRAQLVPYVYEANNDYMTALQLCKAAVIKGKLS
ncbi:hypothetical protein BDF21DRAFT_366294 [Thamnidium elegans]|nr:hypothetical protein BDF21DRAFT_366294 [Thamnidium elegans]